MADPVSWFLIEPGWKVFSADGTELGTVSEVTGDENNDIFDGVVVARSVLDKKYVPAESVGPITEGRIDLTLSEAEVDALDESPPGD